MRNRRTSMRAMDGVSLVFHQAAIRITAVRRGAAAREGRARRRHVQRARGGASALRRPQSDRGVVRVGLRPGRELSDRRVASSVRNRTIYGAAKIFNEGLLRSFNDMYGLDYVALRSFNVYGPRMDMLRRLHRSADSLDGCDRGRPAADDLRRRHAHDGLRPRRGRRARERAGGDVAGHRRGVQHRHRRRNLAERAGATCCWRSWDRRCDPEHAPPRKVNPVSRRLASVEAARRATGLPRASRSRRRLAIARGLVAAASARRSQP